MNNVEETSSKKDLRLVLVDDDPVYTTIINRAGEQLGISIDTFHSLEDLGSVGALNYYDGAILDINLGPNSVSGLEIVDYMEALQFNIPVIVVSSTELPINQQFLPSCVHKVMNKSAGYENVVSEIVECSSKQSKSSCQKFKRYVE